MIMKTKTNKSKIIVRIICIVFAVLLFALCIVSVVTSTNSAKAESIRSTSDGGPFYTLTYNTSTNQRYFNDLGISFELEFFDSDLFLSNPNYLTDPDAGEYYLTYGDCKYFDTYGYSMLFSRSRWMAPYHYLGEVVATTPSSKFPFGFKYNTTSFPDFSLSGGEDGLYCNIHVAIPIDKLPEDRNQFLYLNFGVELANNNVVLPNGTLPLSTYLGKFFAYDVEIQLSEPILADAEVMIFTDIVELDKAFLGQLSDYFPDMDQFAYTLINLVPYVDSLHYLNGTPFTGKDKIDYTIESNLPYDDMVFSPEWRYATYDFHNMQYWAEAFAAGRKKGREEVSGDSEESYNNGYKEGYTNGMNKGLSEQISNPLVLFLKPVDEFMNLKLFGRFALADLFNVVLFVSVALIFIKMFSGG